MITAFSLALLGTGLCLGLGSRYLDLSIPILLSNILFANLSALVALLTTLKAEKVPWLLHHIFNRSLRTWSLLIVLFLGILLLLSPSLRDGSTLFFLLFPLILSTGFAIIIFGPIQDRLVRRQQRRHKERGLNRELVTSQALNH